MSEMVERVAQALISQIGSPWRWEKMPPEVRALWRNHASAAIAAMREPTVKMVAVGARAVTMLECDAEEAWRAMIDAALKP